MQQLKFPLLFAHTTAQTLYATLSAQINRTVPAPLRNFGKKLIGRLMPLKNAERAADTPTSTSSNYEPENHDGISIIVLSYERMRSLELMLSSLCEQDMSQIPFELILCNNSPRLQIKKSHFSRLGRVLRKFPDIRIINSSHNWSTDIRFSLATLAKNSKILFLDDDMILQNKKFIASMFQSYLKLDPVDILSCWNMLWAEWTENFFSAVSLTFKTPQITELTKSDVAGPGICMFNKHILTPNVLESVMPVKYHGADDMGFSLAAYLEHKSQAYYFPSYGMVEFHPQYQKKALDARVGRYKDLHALYKLMFKNGYVPVASRFSKNIDSPEARALAILSKHKFSW